MSDTMAIPFMIALDKMLAPELEYIGLRYDTERMLSCSSI